MQKISRKNLQAIHSKVCQGWQGKIEKALAAQLFADEIEVSDDDLQTAYNAADADQKKMLRKYFTFPQSIHDRIKGIDDIYKIVGVKRRLPYPKPQNKFERYMNASYDIPHITKAYNGDTILDFKNTNQRKWYLFWERKSGGWVLRGVLYNFCRSGLGSGCHFAREEDANDAAVKFKSTFLDYLPE